MTKRKPPEQHRKPGPKPRLERPAAASAAAAPDARRIGPPPSRDIDSLAGSALREYARAIGVSARDCENLTEDRLRQNCKAFLRHHFELLTEG